MKNFLYILIVLIIGTFFFSEFRKSIAPTMSKIDTPYIVINDITIPVELAVDQEKQWQGLSKREFLKETDGMLFVFPRKQIRSFWMKDMNFPLDIIWISDNKIIKIDKDLQPEGENPKNKYQTIQRVDKVLEVNSGFTDKYKIKAGDEVKFYY
ncbi:hypothetical protein A2331_07040 [Candidatus Falkowbacteria bacterium RIFOXYB2_FULL_34_18]|uniref:DUF192 domain-containing protein n=1 Tax=Candidatus Falkowbacteria bacterium RIFOXYD2_FULL_34_120 TaxID=1798007 RepID=A0A1F5TRF5_9BACT|nr:MAG: hypothetical protein A2331_07040 [Candidatus Falkowbacteria bacterium RIFOXYB2_FULL_34_18]OGF29924.1 MAG: hypothetical protein A2500_03635 [Candidatus Falkowbacteria bacterium RIFOXYC12_FULL_34_55]OGF37218.1 MAG: hypothetical protein A2466_02880 [Candidatus Falkowbacteria bacterium RIFOXYC2_FULL_34_220]OGF39462.1 MAG: hypothetical protein A2515_04010 [Candidatus Falkowbacteria bacterium RIFOXYD12_FULL_34_57]OGF41556.1 MAG: hypothetical protein A2531_02595 [Candidatus Falkowbacteria bact